MATHAPCARVPRAEPDVLALDARACSASRLDKNIHIHIHVNVSTGVVVSDALAIAAAVCTAITLLLLLLAPAILHLMAPSMGATMLAHAADYVRIRALGLPVAVAYSVMQVRYTSSITSNTVLSAPWPYLKQSSCIIRTCHNLKVPEVHMQGFLPVHAATPS